MRGYRISLDGETFEVEILSDPKQAEVQVRVDGKEMTVTVAPLGEADQPSPVVPVASAATAPAPPGTPPHSSPPAPAAGSKTLTSPLPGTVIQVAVQAGQSVGAGEELLVIEAMKMNNRIRSPRNGTVGELFVGVGEQVNHGAPLLSWAD